MLQQDTRGCTLCVAAMPLGIIIVETDADLEQIRKHINRLVEVCAHYTGFIYAVIVLE